MAIASEPYSYLELEGGSKANIGEELGLLSQILNCIRSRLPKCSVSQRNHYQ